MKTILPATVVALILSVNCFSQKAPIKFGDVPIEDMQMTVYAPDSSAAAVILADFGVSTIDYNQTTGFKLNFNRVRRLKILNKTGLDYADFEFPLYSSGGDNEKASNIKGITYNLQNGKIVETKLEKENIFREKYDDNIELVKVTFPNVAEGSVIDLSYTVVSDFLFNFQDWEFQSTIPTRWSEYRANIPEYFQYDKYMQGYITLSVNEKTQSSRSINFTSTDRDGNGGSISNSQVRYTEENNRWVAQNVKAFKSEPFLTTYKDFISKMNFELATIKFPNEPIKPMLGDWDEINKNFYEVLGSEIKGNGFLKKTVEEIVSGKTTASEKFLAITNYVKMNLRWDGVTRKYTTSNLKKVVDEKQGNSTEINLVLGSMLEKAGFEVAPVLLSTRDHGMVRNFNPSSMQFNYVLCLVKVDDKEILVDGTEKFLPASMIPEKCLNGNGMVLGKEAFKWINLETKTKSRTITSADLTLSPDLALVGKLKLENAGYAAMKKRKQFFSKGEGEYVKDFIGGKSWTCEKTEFQNSDQVHNNFVESHQLIINENITVAGDIIYLDPFLLTGMKNNPFTSPTREYPVNFGSPEEQTFVYKLTIPDGFVVDELPKPKSLMLPENSARFLYNSVVNGNIISITSVFSINKSLFSQEEYPNLREFYNQVVAKQSEQIVLKKK